MLLAKENESVIAQLRKPIWWLRGSTIVATAALLGLVLWVALGELAPAAESGIGHLLARISSSDALINVFIFLSVAILFLTSLETRFKRRTALGMLHQLRSVAHVVDMHQLTKDPEDVLHAKAEAGTAMTREELARYLGYCGELVSLVAKLAALHGQGLQDPVVLESVNDVEELTSDLSRKVWQKITILDVAHGGLASAA